MATSVRSTRLSGDCFERTRGPTSTGSISLQAARFGQRTGWEHRTVGSSRRRLPRSATAARVLQTCDPAHQVYFRQRGARSFHALSGRLTSTWPWKSRHPRLDCWVQASVTWWVAVSLALVTCICGQPVTRPANRFRGSTDSAGGLAPAAVFPSTAEIRTFTDSLHY